MNTFELINYRREFGGVLETLKKVFPQAKVRRFVDSLRKKTQRKKSGRSIELLKAL